MPTFHFFEENEYFGTLKASLLAPNATFVAREGAYRFYREKWTMGKYFCTRHHYYKAIAEKPLGFGNNYLINFQSHNYYLKSGAVSSENLTYHYELFDNEPLCGSFLGTRRQHVLNIENNIDIPKIIQCFIFWLVYRVYANNCSRL